MINIDRQTFPAEGWSGTIQITKDDLWQWTGVTIPSVAWLDVTRNEQVSSFLWEVDVDVDRNDTGTTRTITFAVATEDEGEIFTLSQASESNLACNIVNVTPVGNFGSSGGSLTVDVESQNGNDSLTSATISTGIGYTTLASTTHGVVSGGKIVTRFVFSIAANTTPSTRSIVIDFQVSDGNGNTDTSSLSKSQAGAVSQQGDMSAGDVEVADTDTTATTTLTLTDMVVSSIVATSPDAWVENLQIQTVGGQYAVVATLAVNTSASSRASTITLTGTDNYGNTITATFSLTQRGQSTTHKITAQWQTGFGYDGVLDYMGGTEVATISYVDNFVGNASISYPATTGVIITLESNTQLKAVYTGGEINNTLVIPILISRVGDDSVTYSTTLNLTLQASGVFPIWRDKKINIPSDEDYEDYSLEADGETFYSGRAFKYPDEANISVNIARVVAPYLTSYYKDVSVYNDGTLLAILTFVRDYSYDPTIDYAQNQILNRPINGKIPSGIKVSVSGWGAGVGGVLQVTDENGQLVVSQAYTKGLNVQEFISGSVGKVYSFGSEKYTVVDACRGALLKYINAYGAMDFFFVEGVCKKEDKITRSSYEKDADALSLDFEKKDYQAEMEATWNGTTGWLSDGESLRMKHLVESVEVYMVDLETGEEKPVVMTDNALQYKTFYKNGHKLVNYTLQWSESQKKIRR